VPDEEEEFEDAKGPIKIRISKKKRIQWLFQKRVVRNKFDIYVFISNFVYQHFKTNLKINDIVLKYLLTEEIRKLAVVHFHV
jgi:hypothetical protein